MLWVIYFSLTSTTVLKFETIILINESSDFRILDINISDLNWKTIVVQLKYSECYLQIFKGKSGKDIYGTGEFIVLQMPVQRHKQSLQ